MIESIVGVAGNVLDKFVADKDLKAKLDHELKTAFHSANLAQIEINKQRSCTQEYVCRRLEAICGWTCGVALAYHFVISPILSFVLVLAGVQYLCLPLSFHNLVLFLWACSGLGA